MFTSGTKKTGSRNNTHIKVVGDLANTKKHRVLDMPPRSSVKQTGYHGRVTTGRGATRKLYYLDPDNGKHVEIIEVLKGAINEFEKLRLSMSGILYVVSTPIGNLEDITLRALRVLKEVHTIAAEDTRHTRKLLTHYGISARLTSYFEHNEVRKAGVILKIIEGGGDVALVSDAGTPGISDPGYRLVSCALKAGVRVQSVPGPSAFTSALSVSGFPIDSFTFKGFIPQPGGKRKSFLKELSGAGTTYVMYESSRRILKTLKDISEILPEAEVAVSREITKINEEFLKGSAAELLASIGDRTIKGEIVLIIRAPLLAPSAEDALSELTRLLSEGLSVSEASKAAAKKFGLKKGDLYNEALRILNK